MKKLLTVILIMLSSIAMYAQNNDFGIFAGSSYYTGDLNPGTPFKVGVLPAYGVLYRYNFTNRLAIKAGYTTTKLRSDDYQHRDLSFTTNLNEISAQFEVNFYEFKIDGDENRISPYIFGGIGYTRFSVKEFSGVKVNLPAHGITNFPFGLGIKYNPIENLSVGAEWGLRKTTGTNADEIDNVFKEGDRVSTANDWYAFAGLFVSYRLNFFQSDHCEELIRH